MLKILQYEWKVYTMQIYKINNSYEKSYDSNEKSCNKNGMKIYIKIVHYNWFFFLIQMKIYTLRMEKPNIAIFDMPLKILKNKGIK